MSVIRLKDIYTRKYAEALAREGEKLILKAYNSANFKKDKTQNLHDSYGSAVYFNRKYVIGTKRLFSARAKEPRFNYYTKENEYGFQEINSYLDNYVPKTNGFVLLVAVAMFYGTFLEKGSGRLKRKYRVLSGISSDMNSLAQLTGGTVTNINL